MLEIPMFKGSGDYQKEKPQNWIQQFLSNKCKYNSSDNKKLWKFKLSLEVDSKVDKWYKGLTTSSKGTWDKVVQEFNVRWPMRVIVKESMKELYNRLLELYMKVEEEGKEVQLHVE